MTRTVSASGVDWGLLTAAGALTIIPGALVIWFVRKHIAKGFAMGGGVTCPTSSGWPGRRSTAVFFAAASLC